MKEDMREPDKPKVNWTLNEGKLYAEMSDFGKEPATCGKCSALLPPGIAKRDHEHEVTHWEIVCICGQICVLYND